MAAHRSRRPRAVSAPPPAVRPAGVRERWLPPALILASGIACYFNSLRIPFIWEDSGAIVNNRTIRALWPLPGPLAPPLETPMAGRPIPNLTLAVNYAWGGLAPAGYHGWNVAIHLACALLLYAIVRATFDRWQGAPA